MQPNIAIYAILAIAIVIEKSVSIMFALLKSITTNVEINLLQLMGLAVNYPEPLANIKISSVLCK